MANFEIDGTRFLLTWPQSEGLEFIYIERALREIGRVKYAVIAHEYHQDGGDHYHAVVLYEKRIKRRGNVFTIGENVCNIRGLKTRKDFRQAVNYVKKDGLIEELEEPPEWMLKPDKQEKIRYALHNDIKDCIDIGYFSFSEIARIPTIKMMYLDKWYKWKKRRVSWFHGATGTGKTRTAMEQLREEYGDDVWISCGKLDVFFNGYCGQKGVILDDFRPGILRFETLLRILDGYPVTVNVKHTTCEWLAETIIITAPVEPCDMFINRETGQEWDHLDQLLRRIDLIRLFK